jgi:hypothetical protein
VCESKVEMAATERVTSGMMPELEPGYSMILIFAASVR